MKRGAQVSIHIGGVFATREPTVIKTLLGSCIAACLRDPDTGVGGMNHFMLPDNQIHVSAKTWVNTPVSDQTRYGNIAMERLINIVLASGGKKMDIEVKVFGGGKVLNIDADIGMKNIEFVTDYLRREGIRVISEDVGGECPRKVQYFPATGRVRIKKLNNMHNQTLTAREKEYMENLKKTQVEGKIDIF